MSNQAQNLNAIIHFSLIKSFGFELTFKLSNLDYNNSLVFKAL